MVKPLWKTVGKLLRKLRIEVPYNPTIPLLGIYPKNMKTLIGKHIHTPMFHAALFTIANIRKQHKCPSMDEWIKMWYIYTMEYYSAIKNEILPFATIQMNLEGIMLSVNSQMEKDKYCMIPLIYGV